LTAFIRYFKEKQLDVPNGGIFPEENQLKSYDEGWHKPAVDIAAEEHESLVSPQNLILQIPH
jgi:hypothetical protein